MTTGSFFSEFAPRLSFSRIQMPEPTPTLHFPCFRKAIPRREDKLNMILPTRKRQGSCFGGSDRRVVTVVADEL